MEEAGIRAATNLSDEKITRKVRTAEMQKIPAMLIVGDKEMESRSAAVRRHGAGDLGAKPLEQIISDMLKEIAEKRIKP